MNQKSEKPPIVAPGPDQHSLLVGEADDQIIRGHKYDGIKEYDNPMPGWWVWIFVATIVFSVVYVVGLHAFDFIPSYEEDLAASVDEIEVRRAAFAAANPTIDVSNEVLLALVNDQEAVGSGTQIYGQYCAACHGGQGEGLIGPNLTDAYWIHGGLPEDVYTIVTQGVAAKGMPAWESTLSAEERANVVAYILQVQGTEPPNAKEPQGELVQ